jgi:DHA2 family multidrug resistance protein
MVERLHPDNPLTQLPSFTRHFSFTTPSGVAALNHEITRQASMIAYIDNFYLMVIIIVVSLPLLLLLRRPRRAIGGGTTAHAMD